MTKRNPNYYKGELKQERIEQMTRILYDRINAIEGWVQLCVMVPGTDHGYKNDRAAIESFRRYFRMGVFPGFIYERGLVKRNPKFKRCERCPCVKEGTINLTSNEGDAGMSRYFCPDCIREIRKVCLRGDYTKTEESMKVK